MIIWGSTTIRYNTWGMHFNAAKRNIMRVSWTRDPELFNYSLTGQVLEEAWTLSTWVLGVTLSNDLEWSTIDDLLMNGKNHVLEQSYQDLA